MKGPFACRLYAEEPSGTFAHGHVVASVPDLTAAKQDPGYWHCDLAHRDRLTWSERVYALFGLPNGAPVTREWAAGCYAEPSKVVLERVRTYAIDRKLGFILDAAIIPEGMGERWIRVLAVPILRNGRVVGLHGLKRAL